MYATVINERVKIIHKDKDRILISVGRLMDYDQDIKTLKIIKDSGKILFINANSIDKLEVLE